MELNFWTILLIIGGALLLFFLFRAFTGGGRARPGRYDSPEYRSRGSIGDAEGGAYDSPEHRSGGSIGGRGGVRTYDSPGVESRGSIGGAPRRRETRERSTGDTGRRPRRGPEKPRHDDEDYRSGGSIGG